MIYSSLHRIAIINLCLEGFNGGFRPISLLILLDKIINDLLVFLFNTKLL